MSKAEDRAIEKYPIEMYEEVGWRCVDKNAAKREYFVEGYRQAEKDLLANKHEKSWRLDEQLWKGIKDVEEASYQYTYDASNDWAYDIPTWDDVQDAFKAGSEWKEGLELTWQDMFTIFGLVNKVLDDYAEGKTKKEIGEEVLKRFKDFRERKEK